METKVSVIIPIYNMEKYLAGCLDSVLEQTLEEIEIICINDGSTDNSSVILNKYAEKYMNIVVINQERKGAGNARNQGLLCAKGQFIAFMDPDDYYASNDALEILYNYAVLHNVKAIGGSMLKEIAGGISYDFARRSSKYRFEQDGVINFSQYQFCWGYQRFIFDGEMLRENAIMFPSYIRGQDPPFMLWALSCAGKIGILSKDIYVIRAFDKRVKYSSRHIINDVARSLYDIITFSIQHNYGELIETGIQELERWKNFFLLHIFGKNTELLNILRKINEELVNSKYEKPAGYYLDMTVDDINTYVKGYSQKIGRYVRQMEKYNEIIVYGAGKVGKSVFDVIAERYPEKFGGFAVSNANPVGTARGKEIYCIDKFLEKRDSALVVIAGLQNIFGQMERNAKKLGFKDMLVIDEEIIDVENFKITDEQFAI